jgi:hypothetical protein
MRQKGLSIHSTNCLFDPSSDTNTAILCQQSLLDNVHQNFTAAPASPSSLCKLCFVC